MSTTHGNERTNRTIGNHMSTPSPWASPIARDDALARWSEQLDAGRAIVGAGAGIGLSAKCAEAADVDLIVIYNAGRYRMAGRGSMAGMMPYGDANAVVVEMAAEVLPIVKRTPVLAGVCATDPLRHIPNFLRELKAMGFSGVQNFPSVCLLDGTTRANLEETGMSFELEVAMVAEARRLDLLTVAYVRTEDEAAAMANAGVDALVAHMGLTTAGTIGAKTSMTLDEAVTRTQQLRDAGVAARSDVLALCHGGPVATPDDAAYLLANTTGVHGFLGASSMERLPAETALTETMRAFKAITTSTADERPHAPATA
jgi:predicted TIM-barrel enzyme